MWIGLQQGVQARTDFESLFGQRDGWRKQLAPWQGTVLPVSGFQHAHRAGHAHGMAAQDRILKQKGLAVVTHKHIAFGTCRGGLAPVVRRDFLAIKVEQKSPAAAATRLRLHQTQHQLHGYGGIQRRAARSQNLVPCIGGQRVGCGHSLPRIGPAGFVGATRGRFGLLGHAVAPWAGGRGGAGTQKQKTNQAEWQGFFHVFSVTGTCYR